MTLRLSVRIRLPPFFNLLSEGSGFYRLPATVIKKRSSNGRAFFPGSMGSAWIRARHPGPVHKETLPRREKCCFEKPVSNPFCKW